MKAKKLLIWISVCVLCVSICACGKKESSEVQTTTTYTPTYVPTEREVPDYSSLLKQNLGVEPAASTFDDLKNLAQTMKDERFFYQEDEQHHYCTLIYNGNRYYVIRYEKAQEWFEYYFTYNDYLDFKEENGRLVIEDESYTGPEGMLMWYRYIAFVDDAGKYLVLVDGGDYVPVVSETDIQTFKNTMKDY